MWRYCGKGFVPHSTSSYFFISSGRFLQRALEGLKNSQVLEHGLTNLQYQLFQKMDEYLFEDYDQLEESQHFSDIFLNDSEVQKKIQFQQQILENNEQKNQKDEAFPTNFTSFGEKIFSTQVQNFPQIQTSNAESKKNLRRIRKIETSTRIEIRNNFTFSGSKNDTVELNTNFKTLFNRFIRLNYKSESETQFKQIEEFEKGVSSFKAFSQLYRSNAEIKLLCSKLIRSSDIVKRVMSSRAKFWMRLQMIKYIEALNLNLSSETPIRWKSIRKQYN